MASWFWEFSQFYRPWTSPVAKVKDERIGSGVCLNTNFNAMITRWSRLSYLVLFFLVFNWGCQSSAASSDGFQDLTTGEFAEKMTESGVIVLDVRTPGETADGMIEGAQELDFRADDFRAKLSELDKEATYLVYCKSGGRSASACSMMKEMGFENVSNLVGGYQRWQAEH